MPMQLRCLRMLTTDPATSLAPDPCAQQTQATVMNIQVNLMQNRACIALQSWLKVTQPIRFSTSNIKLLKFG